MISHLKGKMGEERVTAYLQEKSYNIIKRNFRNSIGEVDIIAVKGNKIVFIEVKTWDAYGLEDLQFVVNSAKVRRMKRMAMVFLDHNPKYRSMMIGFDLVFLSRRMEKLDHFVDFI